MPNTAIKPLCYTFLIVALTTLNEALNEYESCIWPRKYYFFCVYFRNYVLNLNGMEVIIQEIFFALNEWVMLKRGPNLKHNNVLLPFFLCYIHALFKVSKIGLSIVLWNIMSIIVKMSFHIKELDNLLKLNCLNCA